MNAIYLILAIVDMYLLGRVFGPKFSWRWLLVWLLANVMLGAMYFALRK
jgi:hypothetical protein